MSVKKISPRRAALLRRRARIRAKIVGTAERPRLCLYKSLRHLHAQVIDDALGRTIASATTIVTAAEAPGKCFRNTAWAKTLGEEIGRKAQDKGVQAVVFDRAGNRYHGVVKVFADAARQSGLKF